MRFTSITINTTRQRSNNNKNKESSPRIFVYLLNLLSLFALVVARENRFVVNSVKGVRAKGLTSLACSLAPAPKIKVDQLSMGEGGRERGREREEKREANEAVL